MARSPVYEVDAKVIERPGEDGERTRVFSFHLTNIGSLAEAAELARDILNPYNSFGIDLSVREVR